MVFSPNVLNVLKGINHSAGCSSALLSTGGLRCLDFFDGKVELGSWRCERLIVIRSSLSGAPLSSFLREENKPSNLSETQPDIARLHPTPALMPPPSFLRGARFVPHNGHINATLRFTSCRWAGIPYEKISSADTAGLVSGVIEVKRSFASHLSQQSHVASLISSHSG